MRIQRKTAGRQLGPVMRALSERQLDFGQEAEEDDPLIRGVRRVLRREPLYVLEMLMALESS